MKSYPKLCLVSVLTGFIGITYSVPHEFCLDHFDDGDCDKSPVPVFYYYKPGSRCEIRMWRGCPTLNMFPDELSCSHFCIARIWRELGEVEDGSLEIVENNSTGDPKDNFVEELQELDIEAIQVLNQILDEVVQTPHKVSSSRNSRESNEEVTTEAAEAVTTEEATTEAVTEEPATEAPATELATEAPATEPATEPPATEAETTTVEGEPGEVEEVILPDRRSKTID